MATVTGPISGGVRGCAFGASTRSLDAIGYVEEEFFLEGDATLFSLTSDAAYAFDGRWPIEARGKVPFRTRLLVRRPSDSERFNGMVVLNWNNVSRGFEYLWGLDDDMVESGCAWVGISAQRVGLHGFPFGDPLRLIALDPTRYGGLSIPDDDASFDIFTQAARSVGSERLRGPVDPMAGLQVEWLLAFGASQSAMRLATYYNAIQPVSRAFDGFMIAVYSGGGTRVDALGPGPSLAEIPAEARAIVNLLPFGSHLLRDDLAAKVLVLNSETEAAWCYPARQTDSDTYRYWEVAGAAHPNVQQPDDDCEAAARRDVGEFPLLPPGAPPNPNMLPFRPVADTALHHLRSWVQTGEPPPVQERIEFAGDPPEIVRDEHGNACGGIRLPDLDVPSGIHVGASPPGIANLNGSSSPFPPEVLTQMYGDRTAYLTRYSAAVDRGIASGYFLERDAERLRAAADPRQFA
jgi:hypothetical protein